MPSTAIGRPASDGDLPGGGSASGRPGLYLHIPFCSAICPYCDFAVLTGGRRRRAEFVDSLVAEMALWRGEAERWGTFDTLYLGGGTPSALEPAEIARLLAAAREALAVAGDAWIALEANPEDVTAESLRRWRGLGVSMLSLGVQSFDAATLAFLGRRHTPEQGRRAVELALAAGFPTVSFDLIYGAGQEARQSAGAPPEVSAAAGVASARSRAREVPAPGTAMTTAGPAPIGHSRAEAGAAAVAGSEAAAGSAAAAGALARWRRDLELAVELAPHHLSCYQLTVHAGTPFGFRAARGELRELPEEAQADLFQLTHSFLAAHGYAAYEVSNFARAPEHRSRHNPKYWDHTPYLGLGPSAHSFDGRRRWWNERKLGAYRARLAAGERPVAGGEELGGRELALEEVLLSLRTAAGLDLAGFERRHGFDLAARNRRLLAGLAAAGLLAERGGRLVPSPRGLAVADSLARGFEIT
jgi:coproporphyrinogen III oxidase-like Fe-S oxidoreductase